MWKQKMQQMKGQQKSPEKELNEIEVGNLPGTEFKTIVIRMPKELRERMDELSENFKNKILSIRKDIEIIKKTSQK